MDRSIVYPGSIPLDTDLLNTNRNAMVGLGALIAATLGTTTVVDGLAVGPTSPASLSVVVGPGSIGQYDVVDQNAYGTLTADSADALMKMGINLSSTTFALTTPATSGTAVNYLIQAAFQEADVNPVVLPYYNAANPAQPFLGPSNSGAAQATARVQHVQLQLKAGAPATVGSQATPVVDAGWVGLAVITVAYGQTQITAASIVNYQSSRTIPWKLPDLRPGFVQSAVFTASGTFTVPAGVTRAKVTVIGGGGAGGTHAKLPSGGGGAGGMAMRWLSGLTPGTAIPVTVGAGGVAPSSPAQGGGGGTSSFGSYVSATGGTGGGGGTAMATCAGGSGGVGVGGDAVFGGAYGTDGITVAPRGGTGGGPGGGRGTSGLIVGIAATGPGGGGGGGGASAAGGTGTGAQGGNGAAGIVIVEY
jgi:hypothetical protein